MFHFWLTSFQWLSKVRRMCTVSATVAACVLHVSYMCLTCVCMRLPSENIRKIHASYMRLTCGYMRLSWEEDTCIRSSYIRLSLSIDLNRTNLWAYRKSLLKVKCHVCGIIQNKGDLKKHYQRQHPTYQYAPLANDNTTIKLLEPDFVPKKGGFVTGNRYASSEYKENALPRRALTNTPTSQRGFPIGLLRNLQQRQYALN